MKKNDTATRSTVQPEGPPQPAPTPPAKAPRRRARGRTGRPPKWGKRLEKLYLHVPAEVRAELERVAKLNGGCSLSEAAVTLILPSLLPRPPLPASRG